MNDDNHPSLLLPPVVVNMLGTDSIIFENGAAVDLYRTKKVERMMVLGYIRMQHNPNGNLEHSAISSGATQRTPYDHCLV
jgi:hypothetical protein